MGLFYLFVCLFICLFPSCKLTDHADNAD